MNKLTNPNSDFISVHPRPSASRGFKTHDIENMPPEEPDANLFLGDKVLMSAMKREEVEWAAERATKVGELAGCSRFRDLARLANDVKPVLHTHNRVGQRIDFVEYHPAYHELMNAAYASEVHSLAWTSNEKRPHVARAALSYMWNQVENGIGCPNVMSFSIIPLLKSDPEIGNRWLVGWYCVVPIRPARPAK